MLKPKPSYGKLAIQTPAKAPAKTVRESGGQKAGKTEPEKRKRGRPASDRTLKESAVQVVLYLNPRGHKALKRFALDENTKVHSLMMDALEDWSRRHGLREPMRVEATGSRNESA
jgi:hypothetical protein